MLFCYSCFVLIDKPNIFICFILSLLLKLPLWGDVSNLAWEIYSPMGALLTSISIRKVGRSAFFCTQILLEITVSSGQIWCIRLLYVSGACELCLYIYPETYTGSSCTARWIRLAIHYFWNGALVLLISIRCWIYEFKQFVMYSASSLVMKNV